MFSVVSFCTFEQYEKNEPGISLKAKISKKTLKKILICFYIFFESPVEIIRIDRDIRLPYGFLQFPESVVRVVLMDIPVDEVADAVNGVVDLVFGRNTGSGGVLQYFRQLRLPAQDSCTGHEVLSAVRVECSGNHRTFRLIGKCLCDG